MIRGNSLPFAPHDFLRVTLFWLQITLPILSVQAQTETMFEPWRWVLFTTESGLPDNNVSAITEGRDGTPWAATRNGLAWYDGYRWRSVQGDGAPPLPATIMVPYGQEEILALMGNRLYRASRGSMSAVPLSLEGKEETVFSIVPLQDSLILLYTRKGLWTFDGTTLHPFPHPEGDELLSDGNPNLWKTENGDIWLNTTKGLYRLRQTSWKKVMEYGEFYFAIKSIVQNTKGFGIASVVLPADQQGLWEWTGDGSPRRSTTERLSLVQSIEFDPHNNPIVAYESGEVRTHSSGAWKDFFPLPSQMTNIQVLKFRTNGDLWVGTGRGLFLHRHSSRRWTAWRHPFPDLRNSVHDLYRTSDGSIWLGTMRGVEIRKPDGSVQWIDRVLGKPLNLVTGIIEDDAGNIWICSGASFEGAYRWDGRQWKHFGRNEGLDAPRIHKIHKDRSGRLWFMGMGTNYADLTNQPGAFAYDGTSFVRWGVEEGMISGRMYGFAEHPDGSLWFATYAGLSRWKAGSWKHWTPGHGLPATSRVPALAIDRQGIVWFTDQHTGLGMIDGNKEPRFLTVNDGLISPAIWDLKVDRFNTLWISTREGLSTYANGVFSSYTTNSGLQTMRLWEILPLEDKVYIGSSGSGVSILNRTEVSPPPLVELSKPVIEGNHALARWQAYSSWGEIEPDKIETRYKIDNGPWSVWNTAREVQIPDLRTGSHGVVVQAKGLDGNFSEGGFPVSFIVEPGLLEHPAFLIPMGMFGVAFILMGGAYVRRKRKQDAALRESENRYRAVVEDQTEFICRFLPDGTLTFVNDAYCRYLRKDRDELIGKNFKEFPLKGDRETVEAHLGSLSSKTPVLSTEHMVVTPSGDVRWQQWTDHGIFDEHGRIMEIQSVGRDTTERRHAGEVLEKERRLLRTLVEALPDEFALKDPHGRFLIVNQGAVNALGAASAEELIGKTDLDYVRPGLAQEQFAEEQELLRTRTSFLNKELSRVDPRTGHLERCILTTKLPLIDPSGEVVGLMTINRDITERKLGEIALRESEERFRKIFEEGPIGMSFVDADIRILKVNVALGAMLGYEPHELIGKSFQDITHPDDLATDRGLATKLIKGEIPFYRVEKRYIRKNGEVVWTHLTASLLRESNGKPLYGLGMIENIDERKEAEETLRTLSKRILAAQEAERRRVARELHDGVNQIIASGKFRIEFARENTKLTSKIARDNFLKGRALLDYAMVEVRRISHNLRPSILDDFGLGSAVKNLAAEFAQRTGIKTIFTPHDPANPLPKDVEVTVYRIIQEALTNVEKHSRAKKVTIDFTANGSMFKAIIRDNGKGIPTGSRSRKKEQTPGIGLMDMKERASIIGGSFQLTSRQRKGTEIAVEIPLNRQTP